MFLLQSLQRTELYRRRRVYRKSLRKGQRKVTKVSGVAEAWQKRASRRGARRR